MDEHVLCAQIVLLFQHYSLSLRRLLRNRRDTLVEKLKVRRTNLERMRRLSFEQIQEVFRQSDAAVLAVLNFPPRIRTIGRKEHSSEWWHRDVLLTYDEDQWVEDFRMNRRTFFELVDLMRGPMQGAENTVGPRLSVEEKVAIAVYRLAAVSEYRVAGRGFGVSKSTVCNILHTFCKELIRTQSHRLLCWPGPEECVEIPGAFERKCCLPQVLGAIDGSQIPITAPRVGAADFHHRKSFCSIVMQAVVDHRLLFRDVTAQHPGCNHDASVLIDSHLFRNNQRMFPESTRVIDGVQFGNNEPTNVTLPFIRISDPAYPLRSWIMKDYPATNTSSSTSICASRGHRRFCEQAE